MFIFRFHDAGYYFWKLSVQCLDLVSGAGSLATSIGHLHDYVVLLQWNPVYTVTSGPKTFGRIIGVAVLTRVVLQENVWWFLPGGQKGGRNNEVTVLPRWP